MSKFEKLLLRIRSLDRDLRFEELRKVLESFGYTMYSPGSGSSHCTFRKPGEMPITVPRHYPINRAYVELVKSVIEHNEEESEA